jgi:hypothetical protein
MNNDRLRVQIDQPYAEALGLATFCWARCEWDAAWCCELLEPGYIATIKPKKLTAGQIANKLLDLIDARLDPGLKAICLGPATEFKRLVEERNGLMHGIPGEAPNGDQRLFRGGAEWTLDGVNELSDAFSACQTQLNDMVHHHLKNPQDT